MTNPVLVEVTRGDFVESIHRGAVAVVDCDGRIRAAVGDVEALVYPRSSLKPVQALPLIESGAAEHFGLTDEHIALACASHSGEPMHTERVAAWLERIGLSESDLACGPHPPRYDPVWRAMLARGETPTPIHNNCSGKHAGFLTVARHWDVATRGYERVDHPVQQAVATALRALSGTDELAWGIDGCAAPNFVLPLVRFGQALGRLSMPDTLDPTRAPAARRIVSSMIAHPELMSGTDRACARIIRACAGKAAVKTGAEGVYAGIVPPLGLGIVIKIDDGAGRAAEVAIASVLHSLGVLVDSAGLLAAPISNTRGDRVGERRPAAPLSNLTLAA